MSVPRWAVSATATLLLLVPASVEASHTALGCTAPEEITNFTANCQICEMF
jgi:hypothetical protein